MDDFTEAIAAAEADGYDMSDPADAAVIGGLLVGPNIKRIAKLTGVSRSALAEPARLMRRSGIWSGGRICTETGAAPDGIEVAIWCGIARGFLERADVV